MWSLWVCEGRQVEQLWPLGTVHLLQMHLDGRPVLDHILSQLYPTGSNTWIQGLARVHRSVRRLRIRDKLPQFKAVPSQVGGNRRKFTKLGRREPERGRTG